VKKPQVEADLAGGRQGDRESSNKMERRERVSGRERKTHTQRTDGERKWEGEEGWMKGKRGGEEWRWGWEEGGDREREGEETGRDRLKANYMSVIVSPFTLVDVVSPLVPSCIYTGMFPSDHRCFLVLCLSPSLSLSPYLPVCPFLSRSLPISLTLSVKVY